MDFSALKQSLTAAGFRIIEEPYQEGAAMAMKVAAPTHERAMLRDKWALLLKSIFRPYSANPVEKWAKETGNAIPPELAGRTRDASVIPAYPPEPGVYKVTFTPVDGQRHDDSDELTVVESIVETLLNG
jgi:hypothetical protein